MNRAWRIVRPVNLGIVALTFVFIRLFLFQPVTKNGSPSLYLQNWEYSLLAISVILITAAGYIINDIRDVEADRINKPDRQFVGSSVSESLAWRYYFILTIAGLISGLFISLRVGRLPLFGVHVMAVLLLYLYAGFLKRVALAGNLTVSVLIAISVLTPAVFEPAFYEVQNLSEYQTAAYVWKWVAGLAVFSFLLTLPRELVKDLEDLEGDRLAGFRTFPALAGEQATRVLVICWLVVVSALTVYTSRYLWLFYDDRSFLVIGGVMMFGLCWMMLVLSKPVTLQLNHLVSLVSKLMLLPGLLSLWVQYLIIK